jgi:hypothetical protein
LPRAAGVHTGIGALILDWRTLLIGFVLIMGAIAWVIISISGRARTDNPQVATRIEGPTEPLIADVQSQDDHLPQLKAKLSEAKALSFKNQHASAEKLAGEVVEFLTSSGSSSPLLSDLKSRAQREREEYGRRGSC